MALLATNAPEAITVPYLTKARQLQSSDKILKMYQLQMQAKKPVITIFKKKEASSKTVKIKDKDRNYIEALAMLDSGSNTNFTSKNVAK